MIRLFFYSFILSLFPALGANEIKAVDLLQIVIRNAPLSEKWRLNAIYEIDENGFARMWKIEKIKAAGETYATFGAKN